MFDKFADYMYYLLTSPYKRVKKARNQWYILMKVLGRRFDDAMESIYKAREQTALATCELVMLQLHAADRGIKQYAGESDENFRVRIANYPEILRLGGTDAGVLLAVRTLGYSNVQKKTAVEMGEPDRWAEFYIIIEMRVDEQHPIDFSILKKQVRKVKQVGAKDNYLFVYRTLNMPFLQGVSILTDFRMRTYYSDGLRLDGSWQLDGSKRLESNERVTHAWYEGEAL